MKTITQKYRKARVVDLQYHPDNPRQGDVGAIHTSIEANGFYGAIIVQKSTQHVLVGNHRLQAAAASGAATVPIIEVDCDDDTARRILLADNRTNDLAAYDNQALTDLLTSIAGDNPEALLGTGYDGDDLDDLLAMLQEQNSTDGNVARNPSFADKLDRYKESATRSVMLDYPLAEFRWIVDKLGEIREKYGAESSAEAVRILVERDSGETFSAAAS